MIETPEFPFLEKSLYYVGCNEDDPDATNFGSETLTFIRKHDKDIEDIKEIQVYNYDGPREVDVDDFFRWAYRIVYDSGYGAEYLHSMVIIFKDGSYIDRDSYDGSEFWVYHFIETGLPKAKFEDLDLLSFVYSGYADEVKVKVFDGE